MKPKWLKKALAKGRRKLGIDSVDRRTVVNTIQFALEGLSQTLPDSTIFAPLKIVIDGLLFVSTTLETVKQTEDEMNDFVTHLNSLNKIISIYREGEFNDPSVDDAMKELILAVAESMKEIQEMLKQGRGKRAVSSNDNTQTLASQNALIARSLTTFHVASSFLMLRQNATVLAHTRGNNEQAVLDKLPIAEGALYDSADRNFAPRCLENTRVSVLERITKWMADPTAPHLFWLNGMAGTGKSTVAQTIAGFCSERKWLAATFFFSRDRVVQHSAELFFPTLAHQLALFEPRLIPFLEASMKTNSALPRATFVVQFNKLIVEPFAEFVKTEPAGLDAPILLVIDALDECKYEESTRELVHLLLNGGLHQFPTLKVLVTSRPETYIWSVFRRPTDIRIPYRSLALHEEDPETARQDITAFLEQGLHRIRKDRWECFSGLTAEESWPTEGMINDLVDRSAGFFIYASTILKYLQDNRQNPKRQMQLVIDMKAKGDASNVYGYLDELYSQILSKCLNTPDLRRVISAILFAVRPLSLHDLDLLLRLEPGDARTALYDLSSVFVVPQDDSRPARLFHPSFYDYITSKSRSGEFYLDPLVGQSQMASACLKHVYWFCEASDSQKAHFVNEQRPLATYACQQWTSHLRESQLHEPDLLNDTRRFLNLHLFSWFDLFIRLTIMSGVGRCVTGLFLSIERFSPDDILFTAEALYKLALFIHVPPQYTFYLGILERDYHLYNGDRRAIDDAIEYHRDVLKLVSLDHVDRATFTVGLVVALRHRSQLRSYTSEYRDDLPECITLCESMLKALADEQILEKAILCTAYAACLEEGYTQTKDILDLDKAIELYKQAAMSLPRTHEYRMGYLCNAATCILFRSDIEPDGISIVDAADMYLEALDYSFIAPSSAYLVALGYARSVEKTAGAFSAHVNAIARLRKIIWTSLAPDLAETIIRQATPFALKAASLALEARDVWVAIECIIQACIMQWREPLQICFPRPFLPYSELMEEMEKLSNILEIRNDFEPIPPLSTDDPSIHGIPNYEEIASEYEHLHQTFERNRTAHNVELKRFLYSSEGSLGSGRIVILNASPLRCDAVIIRPSPDSLDKELVVQLPIQEQEVEKLAGGLRSLWNSYRVDYSDPKEELDKSGKKFLRRIWTSIVEPIVSALQLIKTNDPPRIWWCLTGPFIDLPVHASGTYDAKRPSYMTDFAVSSYLPTIDILPDLFATNKQHELRNRPAKLFFVEPEVSRLDRPADLELQYMREAIPKSQFVTTDDQRLTIDNVIAQLGVCTGVHIAATSQQHAGKPACADFVLPATLRLSYEDLRDNPVPKFAFLSTYTVANEYSWGTCRTAYDLLSLGFTSVVGVQSSIRAEGAATFSRAFYKSLMWRSGLDFTDAHLALHSAAVEIREEGRKDIHLADWARYIHVGI
ncbi:NACHT domain-containing protein [Pleurotus pulmonarius]